MIRLRRSSRGAAALSVAVCLLSAISAAAEGLAPQHFEKLRPEISSDARGAGVRLEFSAFGRGYRLRLAPNPRLVAVDSGSSRRYYAGTVEGIPESWARITIRDGAPRGMFWDGRELFIVEAAPAESGKLDAHGTVLFRLADAALEQGISFAGDTVRAPREPSASYRALIDELKAATQALQSGVASERLEVSVLGDASYVARHGSETQARDEILTRLNNVDGIFSSQVGVQLHVVSVNLGDALTGRLSATTNSSALLDELGGLRQQTEALYSTGVTHLFTGRRLDGDTAGVAYVSALCSRRFGASLAMAHNSAALESLITAHEIGHVFGAPHDGAEQCAATPQMQYIMTPSLSAAVTSFSQCSLDSMRPEIESASCVATLASADLGLPANLGSQAATAGNEFAWQVSIVNHGERAASGARATLQVTPALTISAASTAGGGCVIQAGLVTCDLPPIEAAATQVLQVTLLSRAEGTFALHAQVVLGDDGDRANDSSDGTLTVSPAGSAPTPPAGESSDGGGGGGGALDGASLLLLLLSAFLSARRRSIGA